MLRWHVAIVWPGLYELDFSANLNRSKIKTKVIACLITFGTIKNLSV